MSKPVAVSRLIAITGATGQLGRLVVAQLKAKFPAESIVAVVRSPVKAADLGVQVRAADYNDGAALTKAFIGVDTVLLISSSELGQRAAQHSHIITAAKQSGVRRLVYTSILHADTNLIRSLADEHVTTEKQLKESGLAYTILRNGWYHENKTAGLGGALAGGALIGSSAEGRISAASRADYAAAAVVVLTTDDHNARTYELAGDKSYTAADLAAELSRQSGKDIKYKHLPEADYAAALASFGLPAGFASLIANWDTFIARDALFDESKQLSQLIGRSTTSLKDAVAHAIQA